MPHIETIEGRGRIAHEGRTGDVIHELRSGEIRTVITVVITGAADITDDVLLESGSFRLLENGDKLLLG